jgi:ankyrin repeat protein
MANYSGDLAHAPLLANELLERNVQANLIDRDGKSPIHVAIKK